MELEQEYARWRDYASRQPTMTHEDVAELEEHLHDQVSDLAAVGLDEEAEVHRIDHVGRVLALGELDHLSARVADRSDGRGVLPVDEARVRLDRGVHEGVDRVRDPEVIGRDHQVATPPAERGHLPSSANGDRTESD